MRARRTALSAAVVLLSAVVLPATATEGCAGQEAVRTGPTGTWTTYQSPGFSIGPAEVTAHAADRSGGRWWATNGIALARSTDTGCSWHEVLVLPPAPTADVPANRATDRIRSLSAAGGQVAAAVEVAAATPRQPVTVNDEQGGLGQSTLVLLGAERVRTTAPLPLAVGVPGPVVIAPSDPRVLYAVAGGRLHASEDRGASWRVATPPNTAAVALAGGGGSFSSDGSLLPAVSRLAVDPLEPRSIWARARGQVFRSDDAGRSYDVLLDTLDSTFPVLVVGRYPGGPPRLSLVEQQSPGTPVRALRVSDDGTSFVTRQVAATDLGVVAGTAQSGAGGLLREDFVLTTRDPSGRDAGVYFFVERLDRLVSVDEFRLGPLEDVEPAGLGYVFRAGKRLVHWEPDRFGLLGLLPPLPIDVGIIPPGLPPLSAQTLLDSPVDAVRLAPGESASVPVTLDLSPEPTPLDVFFLLDTSGSMNDVVRGLASGFAELARELGRNRIDAHFGLGDYQDWEAVRYRRLADIAPPGDELRRALDSITTAGGDEPAYTALHQMATGQGILAPSRGHAVPRGENAGWRAGSLRMVVHATDETVSDRDPDGPRKATVLEVLAREQIRHVGIEVVRDPVQQASEAQRDVLGPGQLFRELGEISEATGSLAPPGGVDCDGDGDLDLREGDPLVCGLYPGGGEVHLAGPLQRVLSTITDLQPVTITPGPEEDARALEVTVSAPPEAARVDVKQSATLDFTVHLRCDAEQAGTSRVLSLRPTVGSRVGQPLELPVVCDPLPAQPTPPPAPPPPFIDPPVALSAPVLALALPPLPPAPPAPVNAPAPANAPAAVQAGAPAVHPVTGVAPAPDEEQVQLVFSEQEAQRAADELAMVDRRTRIQPGDLRLLSMALVCAAASAVALRRREAVRPGRAR